MWGLICPSIAACAFRRRRAALDQILALEERRDGRILAGDRLVEIGDVEAPIDRLLGSADRHRRAFHDQAGPALRRRQQLGGRHHLVDEAEFLAFLRRHLAAGQDHAHRLLDADLARQPVQTAGQRRKANLGLGQRKDGIVRRDDQIAGQRDFETAAHRDAVDRRNHRLVEIEACGQPGKARGRHFELVALGLPPEIIAGAEGTLAGAGDDGDPEIGIGREIVKDPSSSKLAGGCSAFMRSGRLMVTISRWPSRSAVQNSVMEVSR